MGSVFILGINLSQNMSAANRVKSLPRCAFCASGHPGGPEHNMKLTWDVSNDGFTRTGMGTGKGKEESSVLNPLLFLSM